MLKLESIPSEPDEALLYVGRLMSHDFDDMFDAEGEFQRSEYAYVSSIQRVIEIAASRSSFLNRSEYMTIAKELSFKLTNSQLYQNSWNNIAARIQAATFQSQLIVKMDADLHEPTFELSKSDVRKVQELASEMRDTVNSSSFFDPQHKIRLLNRVSSIEKEILKPLGRLDVILGGMSDVGDALKKFGDDAKPIVDRMMEIKKLVRRSSEEYEKLPDPDVYPKLPAPDSETESE